ncbi:ectopic P granules protein 5 homolog isoform X2 [Nematostella vectensis]|uniref:ectopic P granules protein 5 homolog isoform X2 n=1 Tax=Nematostella vectensis TaxID=45351 RepID=UPI0020770F69|nr:ectopic P granules protein 5 homolog isoform X2 [Nematostella vectensis]
MEAVKARKKHRNKAKVRAPAPPTTSRATEEGTSTEGELQKAKEVTGHENRTAENSSYPSIASEISSVARESRDEDLLKCDEVTINSKDEETQKENGNKIIIDEKSREKQQSDNSNLQEIQGDKDTESCTLGDVDVKTTEHISNMSTNIECSEGNVAGNKAPLEQQQETTLDDAGKTLVGESAADCRAVCEIHPSAPLLEGVSDTTEALHSEYEAIRVEDGHTVTGIVHEQEKMYPKLDSLITTENECLRNDGMVVAFTENQLQMFYFNPLLKELAGFTEHFIKISKQDDHEFYALVNAYFKSRNALSIALKEYEIVEKECDVKKEHLWVIKELMVSAQGKCKDNVTVSHNQSYQQIECNPIVPGEIENFQKIIQKALHETLCLQMYTSQLARLRVNIYIHDLLNKSLTFRSTTSQIPVGGHCPPEMSPEFQQEMQKLRDCISVLYMFVRQPQQDQEFADSLNSWLHQLVSVLLRVASLADLVFIVNHIMRCPPGFPSKAAHFIQFPIPHYQGDRVAEQYFWDNPLIHHFVAMLAGILHPVRGREEFLQKLFIGRQAAFRSLSWTLVDEDGEEDEDVESSWMLFQEGDLASVFNQFPFDAVFKHLLKMDPNLDDDSLSENLYMVESSTSRDIMRMLAFASCIVHIMGQAFITYQKVRYRAFIKRVGRTIRQVVQYVLDHWSNYRSWRLNVCGDTQVSLPQIYPLDQQLSIQRLQVEVDQFFMRAAQQIINAHRLGAWQFLADMPFNSVSSHALWRLFWALHKDISNVPSLLLESGRTKPEMQEWRTMLQEHYGEFTDQLTKMSQSEAVFLLTTFTNMATSREAHDRDFIEAVTLEVYEVSFITNQTRDFSSKTGRDLLGTLCGFHPFIISVLLRKVSETIETVGKVCVYMFSGLPVHVWHPCSSDMDLIRSWLLKTDLTSPQHQLARYVLKNMNWGCDESGESSQLFLDRSWHRAVSVMLVEVSALRLPLRPGGIAHENFAADASFLQQVTQIATSSYNRLMQQNHEQTLYDWLWEVALQLRLHETDLPAPVMGFRQQTHPIDRTLEDQSADAGFAGLTRMLSCDEPMDLFSEHSLVNVVNGVKAKGPLASYVALSMTTIGASPDLFVTEGLEYLGVLINERCFGAALRLIANTLPMFLPFPDKLVQDSRFTRILHRLCQLDGENAGYAEKLLLYPTAGEFSARIAGVIQCHVDHCHFRSSPSPLSVLELWMKALCSLPSWYKDSCIQYLLDCLMRAGLRLKNGIDAIQTQLMDAYKVVLKSTGEQSLLSSIMSLVTFSPAEPPLLWEIKTQPDYSYYAYFVLAMEDQLEENAGLRVEISKALAKKDSCTVDHALKKVTKKLKLRWNPQPYRLSIYRWANQALVTSADHPVLPLIWQKFFKLFFERPKAEPGLPPRGGVGYRFFDSHADVCLLKKMKQRLHTIAEHHKSISSQTRTDQVQISDGDSEVDKQFEETKFFHEKVSMFYQTLVLWLDEPRLHDPSLFLPTLPPPYDYQRLDALLKPEQSPWWELVHTNKMDYEILELTGKWLKHAHGAHRRTTSSMTRQWSSRSTETAASRIIRRMKTSQQPLPPPPVEMPNEPLPPLPDSVLMNKQRVMGTVHESLQTLLNHARNVCREADRHILLDRDYIQLLPRMYTNDMTQAVISVPCRSKFRSGHQCIGPAQITLRYLAKHDNEIVIRQVSDNRQEYETMVKGFLQPCPMDVCTAAANVERIITCLVEKVESNKQRKNKEILSDIGTSLFYQLASTIDGNCLRYQPTLQFFSSCIEILGKTFILHTGSQTEQLLYAILELTSITMLLVPFFCPNESPDRFTAMYHEVLETSDKDLAFSLLSKFDLQQWLSSPENSLIERSSLASAIIKSLLSYGFEPQPGTRTVLEVQLRHMSLVLTYNFPEQYSQMLRLICDGSSSRSICLEVWNLFLDNIGCIPQDGSKDQGHGPAQPPMLPDQQVVETLEWLTQYFAGQRAELGGHVTGGIYTMWRPYIKQLSYLLGFLCQRLVVTSSQRYRAGGEEPEKALQDLWSIICSAFEPWIMSQDSPVPGNPPVAPWNESEVPQASDMVTLFTDTISCLHTHFPIPQSQSSLMNLFWPFFVKSLVKPGIPDYVRRVFHSKFFSLPWDQFLPTLNNMQLMAKLHSFCETSFQFLSCVFPLMKWSGIIAAYCEGHSPETVSQMLGTLFHLLLMLATQKNVIDVEGSTLPALLEEAHYYPWHFINARFYSEVVAWLADHGSAEALLQLNSSIWHAIRLARAAAGIIVTPDGSMQPTQPDTVPKREAYVKCIVSLLVRCSSNQKLPANLYPPIIEFILRDVECIAGSGVDPANTASEVCLMLSETLNLLNNCFPGVGVADEVLKFIVSYLKDTSCTMVILASIPAACRALANLAFMVTVLETGIAEFLARQSKSTGSEHDGGWEQIAPSFSVPELAQDSFIEECIHQSALLTLYTYVLLRLSQCTSPKQEMTVLADIVSWCSRMKIRRQFEDRAPLFWHKILQLALRQADYSGEPLNNVARQLSFLITTLHQLGEDKDSSGLLGAIGFGKKSSYSIRFRFLSRVLEAFILAQLPSNLLLRLEPKAPGYVREPVKSKQKNESGRTITSTAEAESALAALEALRSNKHYSQLVSHITEMHSFIANPLHSLRDGPAMVARLATDLYPEQPALRIMK